MAVGQARTSAAALDGQREGALTLMWLEAALEVCDELVDGVPAQCGRAA